MTARSLRIGQVGLLSLALCWGQTQSQQNGRPAPSTGPQSQTVTSPGPPGGEGDWWSRLGAVGNFLSGVGGVSILLLTWVLHRATSKAAEAKRAEEASTEHARQRAEDLRHEENKRAAEDRERDAWSREFREIHADFWQNDRLAEVRGWIANDELYEQNLHTVLDNRKHGGVKAKDYPALETLDRFCALLARVLYLQGQNMTQEQRRLWRMMYYEYWFAACESRPLVAEYMDRYWLDLHKQGKIAREMASSGTQPEVATASDELLRWFVTSRVHPVLAYAGAKDLAEIDLSTQNSELAAIGTTNPAVIAEFVTSKLNNSGKKFLFEG